MALHESSTIIITISFIVVFSPFIARLIKMPTTPVEIVLGSIFGYFGLLYEEHIFELVAEFGFVYLMFIAGTEINLKKMLRIDKKLMQTILIYITMLYSLSISLSLYLHLGKIFMVLLPLISVGLIATLSKEYGKTPWIALAMTAGAVGELISIGALTLTSASLEYGFDLDLLIVVSKLVIFLVIMTLLFKLLQLLFWWYPEVSVALMPHNDNKEQDFRLSMALLFILLGVMLILDLELAFGAFIAGIFVPTFFEHKNELPEKIASFGFGFIVPIFFIYIGTSFHLGALSMDGLVLKAITITFVMILIRVISALVFIRTNTLKESILAGLSHSMPLTLLIAMATMAYHAKSIDILHYYAFILAALFQVIIAMALIKFIINRTNLV